MRIVQCGTPFCCYYYHNKQKKKPKKLLSLVIGVYFILIYKLIGIKYKTLKGEVHLSLKEISTNAQAILNSSTTVQNRWKKNSMHGCTYTATEYTGIAISILGNIIISVMKKIWFKVCFFFPGLQRKEKRWNFPLCDWKPFKLQFLFPSSSFQLSFPWDWGRGGGRSYLIFFF